MATVAVGVNAIALNDDAVTSLCTILVFCVDREGAL